MDSVLLTLRNARAWSWPPSMPLLEVSRGEVAIIVMANSLFLFGKGGSHLHSTLLRKREAEAMVSFPHSRRGIDGDHDHTLQRLTRTSSSTASRPCPSRTGTRLDTSASMTPMPLPTASSGSMVSSFLPSRRVMEGPQEGKRKRPWPSSIFPSSFWGLYSALLSLRNGRVWSWPPPIPLLEGKRGGSHGLCPSLHDQV